MTEPFSHLIGNEAVKEKLIQMVESKNLVHSYLFAGPRGVGKSLFASEYAKMCLCLNSKKPCGKCKSCIAIAAGNHPDFHFVIPDGNSMKIEQMRLLTGKVLEKPIISSKKIYVLDDSDKMTKEAANSLLKTLEEPPEYVMIILIAESMGLLPNTICSRCMTIPFRKIEKAKLEQYCMTNKIIGIENISNSMLDSFDGSFANLAGVKENYDIYLELEEIYSKIEIFSKLDFVTKLASVYTKGKEQVDLLLDYTDRILFQKIKEDANKKSNLANCIQASNQAKVNLKRNNNFDMAIDKLIFTIWEEMNEKNRRC